MGGPSRGTPGAIVFVGMVLGLLAALTAAGLILVYRTSRVINFAQASIGAAGGVFTYNLAVAETTRWPYFLAFIAGAIVASLMGAILELGFIRRFFTAPRLVLTVFTIALIPAIGYAVGFVRNLPIFGAAEDRDILETQGAAAVSLPFSDFQFLIGDLDLSLGFPHLFGLLVSVAALVALALFLRFSRSGIAIRASAENVDRALLLGVNVKGLSTLVWTIAGLLSGLSVILSGTISGFQGLGAGGNAAAAASAILVALAAAVLARMQSLTLATVASIAIVVLRQSFVFRYRDLTFLFDAFLFGIVLVALLLQRKSIQRAEEGESSSWKASEEFRPVPKEMSVIPGIRITRAILVSVGVLTILVFPWAARPSQVNLASYLALIGIVMLSLVVLTGWAGQVSLGQFALVAVGALLAGAMTTKWGISFWLAIPLVIIATALVAVVIGLPALRIRGLFLAITTFAFAVAVETNLFEEKFFGWILPGAIDRPSLFIFDFEDERSMYYLSLFAFVLAIGVVLLLRRSRPGRVLIALRENEENAQSFGISIVRTRLAAFAIAGGLCGLAGVFLAHHQRAIAGTSFPATESLQIFIFSVIGGIGSVSGAILGAGYYALYTLYGDSPLAGLLVGPIGLLLILYMAPGGLSSLAYGLRDGILRIIAQRRRMVVPSLFADVDPEAVERQLAPLADALPNAGLALLPFHQRYRTDSWLYKDRGRLSLMTRKRRVEAEAFGLAAEKAEEREVGAAAEDAASRAVDTAGEVAKKVAVGPTAGGGEE